MKFKTNINCSGCVVKVTPLLNEAAGEHGWQVDTIQPDKPLTVTNDNLSELEIMEAVKKGGFQIETL